MASSIFVDGVKFIPAVEQPQPPRPPQPPQPVLGCRDYIEEIQRFDLYMTEQAYDHVKFLPNNSFKASNGYVIQCADVASSLSDTLLQLHANTFRGARVELYDFFNVKKSQVLTKELAPKIKLAMQELAAAVDRSPQVWNDLEKY